MSYRNVVAEDRDKVVSVDGRSGRLLATWNGFAWIGFDPGRQPETWPMSAVWIPETVSFHQFTTLLQELSGESTVATGLLLENRTLVKMMQSGKSKEECLRFINENW